MPGTVGIICIVDNGRLFYGYIGDCYGRIIRNNEIVMFTKCQTEKIATHRKEFSASEIRNKICNNIKHLYSYGVLTGQKEALDFVVLGEYSLNNDDMVFLSSDGMEPFLSSLSQKDFTKKEADYYLKNPVKEREEDDKAAIIIFNR